MLNHAARTFAWVVLAAACWGLALAVVSRTEVTAHHSVPNPKWVWDKDNNYVADDPEPMRFGSTGFSQAMQDQVTAAATEWRTDTDFDPVVAVTSDFNFFTWGVTPPSSCQPGGSGGFFGAPARTCIYYNYKSTPAGGTYYDIYDTDIYFNSASNWSFGCCAKPSDPNQLDFRGIATHEIGHTARLQHIGDDASCVQATAFPTMCDIAGGEDRSPPNLTYYWRSVENDDRASANNLYP